MESDKTPAPTSGGTNSDADLAKRMVDEALANLAEERAAASGGRKSLADFRAKRNVNGQRRLQGLLALRSGLEQGRQREAIERLAQQESKEAANGIQN